MRVWFSFIKRFTLLLNTRAHHLPHGSLVLHFRGVSCVHESLSLFTQSTIRVIAFLCNEKHQHIAQRWSDRFSQESAKQQWPWDFSISSETIFIINTILPWPTKSFKRAKEGRVGFWWHLLTDSETRCSGPSSLCRLSDPDSYSHFIRPTSSIPQWTWFRQNSFYDLLIMNKGRTLSRWCFSSMEKGNLTNAHPTTALQQWQWHAPPNCSGTSYFGWYCQALVPVP